MEVINRISVFSSYSLKDATSIILYKEDPDKVDDSSIYEHVDLSKKVDKKVEGYYMIEKDYFDSNVIIFLSSDLTVLGYTVLAKSLIESVGKKDTHNIKTTFKPNKIELTISGGTDPGFVQLSLYHKLVSLEKTEKFKNVLCTSENIISEVPVNKYGTVMSSNNLVLNGWSRNKEGLWKLGSNGINASFDFTGWNIDFMFYKGDPCVYFWKDDQYSIQSLTRKTPLGTAYPYTLPKGDENTVIHTFDKGSIDWVYGDLIKSGGKLYFWEDEKEYSTAEGIIIDHFSKSNKLYTLDTLIELNNLIKPYKELRNYELTDKYGDWFVFDGRIFVNSKFYKEFEKDEKIIPLNNRALLNLTDRKIYCSNGEVLEDYPLDTFRRGFKRIIDIEGESTILLAGVNKETVQGNIVGSIGSLIYYSYEKENLNYL